MPEPYTLTPAQLAQALSADLSAGLSGQEARRRLARDGENRLRAGKRKSPLRRFAEQLADAMILILLAAAAISFGTALAGGEAGEFFEPVLILLIVILNAIIGAAQESRAERALDALQTLSAPKARVLRDGREQTVEASALVAGDVISLEAGDLAPADARLLSAASLRVEEAALTGEPAPAEKDAEALLPEGTLLGDRKNMVFSGCTVSYGRCTALVTATGMETELGKIARLLEDEKEGSTPLQQRLAKLGKQLGLLAVAACAVIFLVGWLDGQEPMELFMTAVALAVSAIPEGLPAVVTVALSIGVQRMVKRGAIIRRLPAVETLGSASVICSDKTGTLTQNRMTLVSAWADGEAQAEAVAGPVSPPVKRLLRYGTLCCDATVTFEDDAAVPIGDPTETAIIMAAHQAGMAQSALQKAAPRLAELPFDSDRKRMSVVYRIEGRNIVIVKGAFDGMVPLCRAGDTARAQAVAEEMGGKALRVLALAWKEIVIVPARPTPEALESELTLLGLVGMIDPPRAESGEAVALCRRAGIRPVMITGDHLVTARAIARELDIFRPGDQTATGQELAAMSDGELTERVERISVYARVSPQDKIRIVKAWQRRGAIAAMTGDGVNDAPALKAADIGCAMGVTGTDAARGAADMVLTDDNFATIVEAVREGRGIYDNIRKVTGFLLGTNTGEVIAVFAAMLLWRETPLLSMQLLWINLVTDSLPAIALGMEAVEPEVMDRPPRPKNEGILAHGLGLRVALQGLMFAILALIAFALGRRGGDLTAGRTMAFAVLAVTQILQAFHARSRHSLFRIGVFSNRKLNWAAAASLALMALVLFTPLRIPFGLVALSAGQYGIVVGLSLLPSVVMEAAKAAGWIR